MESVPCCGDTSALTLVMSQLNSSAYKTLAMASLDIYGFEVGLCEWGSGGQEGLISLLSLPVVVLRGLSSYSIPLSPAFSFTYPHPAVSRVRACAGQLQGPREGPDLGPALGELPVSTDKHLWSKPCQRWLGAGGA